MSANLTDDVLGEEHAKVVTRKKEHTIRDISDWPAPALLQTIQSEIEELRQEMKKEIHSLNTSSEIKELRQEMKKEINSLNTSIRRPHLGQLSYKENNRIWEEELLAFIHVGKTGGSSARCMLKNELREAMCKNNPQFDPISLGDGVVSAVTQKTIAVCHEDGCGMDRAYSQYLRVYNMKSIQAQPYPQGWVVVNYPGVIISIRDPIERMISWFHYTRDHLAGHPKFIKPGEPSSDLHLCYRDFVDMSNAALAAQEGRLSENQTDAACQKIALMCVNGETNCAFHHWQNFTWYTKSLFDPTKPTPKIYAIRNEFKWQDFHTTNLLLGGSAKSFNPETVTKVRLRPTSGRRNVDNTTRTFLCKAMCPELHVYIRILRSALNLHGGDIKLSLQSLGASCGMADISQICPNSPF